MPKSVKNRRVHSNVKIERLKPYTSTWIRNIRFQKSVVSHSCERLRKQSVIQTAHGILPTGPLAQHADIIRTPLRACWGGTIRAR
eukprot:702849-Pyramimonas_sp.AAC.1